MKIPDHELVCRIGQGSYGEVWLARHFMGSYRAAKFIFRKTFRDSQPYIRELAGIQRFEPVSRSHPGFVHVLHVGRNDTDEYFYYLMELADDAGSGPAIHPENYRPKTLSTEIARHGHLASSECLKLAVRLSSALAHLHEKGLVHRDIKPSNIVFVDGEAKLADIGLVTGLNEALSYVGTEGFIPPEGPGSPQADIYSFGKALYEAATGKDRQQFPELPAALLSSPDAERFLELNEIIVKACDPNRERRYASASEMLRDLQLIESGRSLRRMRRRAALLKTGLKAAAVLTVAGGIAFWILANREEKRRVQMEEQKAELRGANTAGIIALGEGRHLQALSHFIKALEIDRSDPTRSEKSGAGAEANSSASREEGHRMRIHTALLSAPKLTQMWFEPRAVQHAEFSPDGALAVIVSDKVSLKRIESGTTTGERFGPAGLTGAALSPSGTNLLTISTNGAALWNLRGQKTHSFAAGNSLRSGRFSANGAQIITAGEDGIAMVWSASGELIRELRGHRGGVIFADFSRDGAWIVTCGKDGQALLWDAKTGKQTGRPMQHGAAVYYASFSPDGQRLVTACIDHKARLWRCPSGEDTAGLMQLSGAPRVVQFSADGMTILTAGERTVNFFSASGASVGLTPLLNSGSITSADFDHTGRRVITASNDGSIRVWDLSGGAELPELLVARGKTAAENYDLLRAGRGQFPAAAFLTNALRVQLLKDGKTLRATSLNGSPGAAWEIQLAREATLDALYFSKNGDRVANVMGKTVQIHSVTNRLEAEWSFPETVQTLAFDAKSARVAVAAPGEIFIRTIGSDSIVKIDAPAPALELDFSAEGKTLIACLRSRFGEPVNAEYANTSNILPLTTNTLANLEDHNVLAWNVDTGEQTAPVSTHNHHVSGGYSLANRSFLLTVNSESALRIWDPHSAGPASQIVSNKRRYSSVTFLPNAKSALAVEAGGSRIWLWLFGEDTHLLEDLRSLRGLLCDEWEAPERGTARIEKAWKDLSAREPGLFRPKSEDIFAWHTRQARIAARDSNWAAAILHLEALLAMNPQSQLIAGELADARKHDDRVKASP